MAKAKITYTALEKMEPDGKQHWISWPGTPGLTFAMTKGGSKSWILRYGRDQKVKTLDTPFGKNTLTEAKKQATEWRNLLLKGIIPWEVVVPPPAPAATTRMTVTDLWLKLAEVHLPTNSLDHQGFQLDVWTRLVEPALGKLAIADVDSGIVNAFLDTLPKAMANKVQSLISLLWKVGVRYYPKEPGILANPCWGRPKHKLKPVDRKLEPDEFIPWAQAWLACDREDKFMLMFELLTGCRDGVTINYNPAWREDPNYLVFPPRTRGVKGALYLVLPKVAQPLIDKFVTTDYYRLNRTGRMICKAAGIPGMAPHDLRRSWGTTGEDMGESIDQLDACLGHPHLTGVRKAYFKRSIPPLVPISNRVAQKMLDLLGLTQADLSAANDLPVPAVAMPVHPEPEPEPKARKRPAPGLRAGVRVTEEILDLDAFLGNPGGDDGGGGQGK